MKVMTGLIISSLMLSIGTDASELAKKYFEELRACEKNEMACTGNYNPHKDRAMEILKKRAISDSEFEAILQKSKVKSIFIPLELNNTELVTLAAATSLGLVAFKNDQEITNTISKNQTAVAKKLEAIGKKLGEETFLGVAAGSYFLGAVIDNDQIKQIGLYVVGAEIAQGIVTGVVKNLAGRKRPHEEEGPYQFFNSGHQSFYSGHTATSFTLATVLAETYGKDYPVVPYVAYGAAALTAYARVHAKAHWASDVIIGGVAGHLIAKLAMSQFNKDNNRGGLLFYPSYDENTGTFNANFEWVPRGADTPLKCLKIKDESARVGVCLKEAFEKSFKN